MVFFFFFFFFFDSTSPPCQTVVKLARSIHRRLILKCKQNENAASQFSTTQT